MDSEKYSYEVLILEHHLDTFGHVNNAQYLSLMEQARWDLSTNNGYGLDEVLASNLGPIILEVKLRFKKEIKLRETITIETHVTSYKGKIATLDQRMVNRAGEVCAEAEFLVGFFDLVRRKLIPPTEKWLRAIGVSKL